MTIIQTLDGASVKVEYRGPPKQRQLWFSVNNGKNWIQFNSRSMEKLTDFIKSKSLQQLNDQFHPQRPQTS